MCELIRHRRRSSGGRLRQQCRLLPLVPDGDCCEIRKTSQHAVIFAIKPLIRTVRQQPYGAPCPINLPWNENPIRNRRRFHSNQVEVWFGDTKQLRLAPIKAGATWTVETG